MNLFHVWIFLKSEEFLFAFHIHWIGDYKFGHDFQRFFDISLDEDLDEGVLGDIGKVAKAAGK